MRRVAVAAASLAVLSTVSCSDLIFQDEGDCDPRYKVKFRYDWNMKWADAFPNEVNSVTLYLIDEAGAIAWQRHDSGDAVKAEGFMMDVDVAPGTYTLLAWAGDGHKTHFTIPSVADMHHQLQCTLTRDRHSDGSAIITHDIDRLYHGMVSRVTFPDEQGTHIFTVPLKKNTNTVRVVLQHLSGEPVDESAFTFRITDSNGLMDWDNELLDDEPLTYHAWDVRSGTAAIERPYAAATASRLVSSMSAAVAEFTVGRLVKGHDMRLTITNPKGEVVASVPVIDYALLVKGNHNRPMDDQEYLDRQDEYNMTFFLDEGDRWVSTFIYINSWKVVLQNTEL